MVTVCMGVLQLDREVVVLVRRWEEEEEEEELGYGEEEEGGKMIEEGWRDGEASDERGGRARSTIAVRYWVASGWIGQCTTNQARHGRAPLV
jgi:hypothetical protein